MLFNFPECLRDAPSINALEVLIVAAKLPRLAPMQQALGHYKAIRKNGHNYSEFISDIAIHPAPETMLGRGNRCARWVIDGAKLDNYGWKPTLRPYYFPPYVVFNYFGARIVEPFIFLEYKEFDNNKHESKQPYGNKKANPVQDFIEDCEYLLKESKTKLVRPKETREEREERIAKEKQEKHFTELWERLEAGLMTNLKRLEWNFSQQKKIDAESRSRYGDFGKSPFDLRKHWVMLSHERSSLQKSHENENEQGLETLAEWKAHLGSPKKPRNIKTDPYWDRTLNGTTTDEIIKNLRNYQNKKNRKRTPGDISRAKRSEKMFTIGGEAIPSPLWGKDKLYIANPRFEYQEAMVPRKWKGPASKDLHVWKLVNQLKKLPGMSKEFKGSLGQISWGPYETLPNPMYDFEGMSEREPLDITPGEVINWFALRFKTKKGPKSITYPLLSPARLSPSCRQVCKYIEWNPAKIRCTWYDFIMRTVKEIEKISWKARIVAEIDAEIGLIHVNPDLADRSLKGLWCRGAGGLTDEIDNRTYWVNPDLAKMAYINDGWYLTGWQPPEYPK